MDSYVKAWVKTHLHIDSGNRAFADGKELEVVMSGGERKVVLPMSKVLYTFDDLKRAGCKCDVITLKSLAMAGAEGRWKENIEHRKEVGVPSNVYIANARSIELAIAAGKEPPSVKWVGRKRDRITEVRDTIDEVIDDMDNDRWRTSFSRGRYAKKGRK